MGSIKISVGGKCDACGHHQHAHSDEGCNAPNKDNPEEICGCNNKSNY